MIRLLLVTLLLAAMFTVVFLLTVWFSPCWEGAC